MAVCLDYQSVYVKREKVVGNKLLICAVLLLMSVLIFRVWIRAEKVALGYQIAEAQNKTKEYSTIKKDLATQLSVLKRYDNLMGLAQTRLNFNIEAHPQVFTVEY
ncbi:MAG: hypothetical protein ACOX3T_04240 [Bdellovibrionota bacterium]